MAKIIESEGWAIRNDGQGWRSVVAGMDLEDDEYFMATTDGPPPDPVPLPPTPDEILALAKDEVDKRLGIAALRIAPLQDAVDLEDATPVEVALLKKWKQYRVAVNRVPDQGSYPLSMTWPPEPA